MGIILKTNELGYMPFLETPVNSFIIGLKKFCVNHKYALSVKELPLALSKIKGENKNFYLSVNMFAKEKDLKRFAKVLDKLIYLDIDGFVVSDLGILNILKEKGLMNKVILDLQTYVTNKYSAKYLLDLKVKRVCISKEITLNDIKDISLFTNGKIEVLCQGYCQIAHSKRPLLNNYYKNFKLQYDKNLHFIKEESRDNYYYLNEEKDDLTVYNDKEYSLFSYLPELINSQVRHFKIDATYLDEKTLKDYIYFYKKAIDNILVNNHSEYEVLKKSFSDKYTFDAPFLHNQSSLLKEDK